MDTRSASPSVVDAKIRDPRDITTSEVSNSATMWLIYFDEACTYSVAFLHTIRLPNCLIMTASSPDITAEIKSLADRFEHLETTQDKTDALTYLAHIVQNPSDKPLETLPCANVDPARNWRCPEDGKLACSECRLVSYCSKVSSNPAPSTATDVRAECRHVNAHIGVYTNKVTSTLADIM